MKTYSTLFILLCMNICYLYAQTTNDIPRNNAGVFAGIEWNSVSGLWGLQYERSLIQQDKLSIGAKALYVFRYELGNMKILGGGCCEYNQSVTLLANAACYTSPTGRPNRFYLQAGLGAGLNTYAYESLRRQSVFPAFEAGLGFKFPLNDRLNIQWHNSLLFLHKGGATTNTGVSLGF